MLSPLKNKSSKNAFYGVIDVLITPILMLALTPVLIKYLGIQDYAIWVLVNSIVSTLALFNFAGTDIVIRFVSLARIENNSPSIKNPFGSIFVLQICIAVSIYILFCIFLEFSKPYFPKELEQSASIFFFVIPMFFIKQFEQLIYAFFKGHEQYDHVAFLSLFSKFIFLSVQAVVAVITSSVYEIFVFALMTSAIIFAIEVIYIKKIHANAFFFKDARFKNLRPLVHFGGWNWLSSFVSILTVNSDKWMVSTILGLTTFGYYSLGILIFNQLHNILAASVAWIFPKISKGGLKNEKLITNYYFLMSLVTLASLVISLVLNQLDFLFEIWLGFDTFQASKIYINLFLIMLPIYTLHLVSYYHLLGLGLVKNKFIIDIFVFLIKIISLYIAIVVLVLKWWPLAFLVFSFIQVFFYAKVVLKHLNAKLYPVILIILSQLLIVVIRIIFL